MMTVFLTNSLLLKSRTMRKVTSRMRTTWTPFLTRQVQRKQNQKWKKMISWKTSLPFLNEEVRSNEYRWQYGLRRAESSGILKRLVKHRSLRPETSLSVWFWILPRLTKTEGWVASGQEWQRACPQTFHQEEHWEVSSLFDLKLQILLKTDNKPAPWSENNPLRQVSARNGLLQCESRQWHYLQRWHSFGKSV